MSHGSITASWPSYHIYRCWPLHCLDLGGWGFGLNAVRDVCLCFVAEVKKQTKLLFLRQLFEDAVMFVAVSEENQYDGVSQAQFDTRDSRNTKLSFVLDREGVFLNLLCMLFRDISPPNSKDILGEFKRLLPLKGISRTTGWKTFLPGSTEWVEFVQKISEWFKPAVKTARHSFHCSDLRVTVTQGSVKFTPLTEELLLIFYTHITPTRV